MYFNLFRLIDQLPAFIRPTNTDDKVIFLGKGMHRVKRNNLRIPDACNLVTVIVDEGAGPILSRADIFNASDTRASISAL